MERAALKYEDETVAEHVRTALQLVELAMPDKKIVTAQRELLNAARARLEKAIHQLEGRP